MKYLTTKSLLLLAAATLALGMAGCGGGDGGKAMLRDAVNTNLRRTCSMYGLYQARHGNTGPADEAEFKKFLSEVDAGRLSNISVDPSNREAILVSERDGKPFKIRWGITVRAFGPSKPIVFEEEGVDGKRMVGFTGSAPREVDAAEYDKLWAGEMDDAPTDSGRPSG